MDKVKFFISYAHSDRIYFETIKSGLENFGKNSTKFDWDIWTDENVLVGSFWDESIQEKVFASDIAVLLVSENFLASEYIKHKEVDNFFLQAKSNQTLIFPVLVSPCYIQFWDELAKIQLFKPYGHKYGKPNLGSDFSYADLVDFNKENGELIPNPNRSRYHRDLFESIELSMSGFSQKKIEIIPESQKENNVSDIDSAIKLFKLKNRKLDYKTTKEEIADLLVLKEKIYENLFKDFDETIFNTRKLAKKNTFSLFEFVINSETISESLCLELNKVRNEKSTFTYIDRYIISSSLTISLLNFKKFDRKKIHLLLDFVFDHEDKVWQNALTGAIISLLFLRNKWKRFNDIKDRLQLFKDNSEIQKALSSIDFIFRNDLYKFSIFNEQIFEIEFFQKNLANCFCPFDPKNPAIEDAFLNSNSDIDLEKLLDILCEIPLLDPFKYYLFFKSSQIDGELKDISESTKDSFDKTLDAFLNLSDSLNPYQNIIANLYNFYKSYPSKLKNELFEKYQGLSNSTLNNLILSEKSKLKTMAASHMKKNKYKQAIKFWKELLLISPKDNSALWNICNCYAIIENYKESIKFGKLFLNNNKSDKDIYLLLSSNFRQLKEYNSSKKYLAQALEIDSKNITIRIEFGHTYFAEENFKKALEEFKLALDLDPDNGKAKNLIGDCYNSLKKYELALNFHLDALENDSENLIFIRDVVSDYEALFNFDMALKYMGKLMKVDRKNSDYQLAYGRLLLFQGKESKRAKELFNSSLKKKKEAITYGNLGHWELVNGKRKNALHYYKNCIVLLDDPNDFIRRCNMYFPYLRNLGVKENVYNNMKDEIVLYYNKSKNN